MSTVRLRRLQADYEKVTDYVRRHPRLQLIQADGTPPERYQVEFQVKGLRQKGEELAVVASHMVEVLLPLSYPRMPPQCRMLTPVFHPNIAPHAICIGDHWSPGEPLWSILARIGEMISYQSYNTRSPLNGEAARWVEQHKDDLPLDPISLMPDEPPGAGPATAPPTSMPAAPAAVRAADNPPPLPTAAASPPTSMAFACTSCRSMLKMPREMAGKRVRCPRCQAILRAPGGASDSPHG